MPVFVVKAPPEARMIPLFVPLEVPFAVKLIAVKLLVE